MSSDVTRAKSGMRVDEEGISANCKSFLLILSMRFLYRKNTGRSFSFNASDLLLGVLSNYLLEIGEA